MPHSHTIERARFVATSMSFPAPVVFWLKVISRRKTGSTSPRSSRSTRSRSSGRPARRVTTFSQKTTGAGNDIEVATNLARSMVCEWGMSERWSLAFGKKEGEVFLGRDMGMVQTFSKQTARDIDAEVHRIVTEQYERAKRVLLENGPVLTKIADALIEYETLDASDIDVIISGGVISRPPPPKPLAAAAAEREGGHPRCRRRGGARREQGLAPRPAARPGGPSPCLRSGPARDGPSCGCRFAPGSSTGLARSSWGSCTRPRTRSPTAAASSILRGDRPRAPARGGGRGPRGFGGRVHAARSAARGGRRGVSGASSRSSRGCAREGSCCRFRLTRRRPRSRTPRLRPAPTS